MRIVEVKENRKQYLDLLLLADEQEDMVDRYLDKGRMFVLLSDDGKPLGEAVVVDLGETDEGRTFEIKNIATDPEVHGKGFGRKLIDYVMDLYADDCDLMLVGTGDSPLTVPFYKKCGFTEHHRLKNFFTDNYDHPILKRAFSWWTWCIWRRNRKGRKQWNIPAESAPSARLNIRKRTGSPSLTW